MSTFENVSSTLGRLFALLTLLALALLAPAQGYPGGPPGGPSGPPAPTGFTLDGGKPTGGAAANTNPGPPTTYTWSDGTYGGTSNTGDDDACTGPLTWSWTWQGPGPAPSCVVLQVSAYASWTGPPGDCDDGLGQNDPKQTFYSGTTLVNERQSGTKYVVKPVSGNHVSYTVTPTSHAYHGTCNAGASVALTPVTLTVGGVVTDSSTAHDAILVGQGATGTLSAGGYTIDPNGYQWSVGGDKFASWVVSGDQSTGTLNLVPASEWSQAQPHWYWCADQNAITVACTATLVTPDGISHSVSASRDVDVWPPDWSFVGTPAPRSLYIFDGDLIGGVEAADSSTQSPGMLFDGAVGTPAVFSGDGYWSCLQIASPVQHYTSKDGHTTTPSQSGRTGLDNDWPYPIYEGDGPPWNAGETDGTPFHHRAMDSPIMEFPAVFTQIYSIANEYQMYEMYRPPGGDTQWVPVSSVQWGWVGGEDRGNGDWTLPPLLTIIADSSVRQTVHPTWTDLILNGS